MQSLQRIITVTVLLLALPAVAVAAIEDYFVQSDWLAANRTQVVVLDARQAPLYLLGHIAGAYSVPRSEFLDKRGGVKSLVPTTTDFEALMERFGITPDTTVITYAEHDNPYAARLAWTLRYHGHEKTLILDGGYEKWSSEGHPTSLLTTAAAVPSTYRVSARGET